MIRVYDEAGNVIETHEHKGDFKEPLLAIHQFRFVPVSARDGIERIEFAI